MSAYDNDPRVFDETGDGTVFTILPRFVANPSGKVAPAEGGEFVAWTGGPKPVGPGFATADDAIRSLIGDPQ